MKSITAASLLFVFIMAIAVSCNRKSTPVIATRTELPPPPPPAAPAQPAVATNAAVPTPSPMPMMGVPAASLEAGRVIYTTKCTKCHMAKPVDNWTVDQWQPILRSMIKKTKLDSLESSYVTAWVNTHAKKN